MRLTIALILWPGALHAAEGCIDSWVTRNLIFDRAGYCFASALGQALFDNSDCTTHKPALSVKDKALTDRLAALERQHGCAIDTSYARQPLDDFAFRRVLLDLPVRSEAAGWACYGWLNGPTALLYGHIDGAPQIGQILPGDSVSFEHDGVGDYSYVTVYQPPYFGTFKSAGWLKRPENIRCAQEAG